MSYKVDSNILFAKVLCFEKSKEDMGLESNVWLEYAFDIDSIYSIKNTEYGESEPHKGTSGIHLGCEYFIVQVPFEQMTEIWRKHKLTNEINRVLKS